MCTLDWHSADIIAAVKKATGLSLRRLSMANQLNEQACQQSLHRPYEKAESVISMAISVPASEIWPSRYNPDGTRKRFLYSQRLTKKDRNTTFKPKKSEK